MVLWVRFLLEFLLFMLTHLNTKYISYKITFILLSALSVFQVVRFDD